MSIMSPSISTSNTSSTKSSSAIINPSASSSSSSSSSGQTGTANSACAACRHQRRRCKPDCTLAPYFPANDQHKFLNAHRLFGVSNIIKIIANLDPLQRNEAMRTIIFQSDMRAQDPVGGCYQLIQDLDNQIKHHLAELQLVHRQLSIYRAQAAAAAAAAAAAQASDLDVVGPGSLLPVAGAAQDVVLDPDAAVNIYEANLYSASINNNLSQQQHEQQQFYNNNYFCFDNINGNNHNNGNCVDVHSNACDHNLLSTLQQQQQHHQCVVGDDEEVKPLVDMFEVRTLISADDDRDSSGNNAASTSSDQINGSDLHGLSLELKEDVLNQVAQEHDLKGAASLFTLTNYSSSVL